MREHWRKDQIKKMKVTGPFTLNGFYLADHVMTGKLVG